MRLVCLLIGVAAFAQTRESIEKQLKSVEQQRESIRKMMPVLQAKRAPECDPMPEDQVSPIVEGASKARRVPAEQSRGDALTDATP